jgi:hypothetical protein
MCITFLAGISKFLGYQAGMPPTVPQDIPFAAMVIGFVFSCPLHSLTVLLTNISCRVLSFSTFSQVLDPSQSQ